MRKHKLFVSGIGTDVGKTVVSAILTEALEADYWKPVQSGDLEQTDKVTVSKLLTNKKTKFFKERYSFKEPASPHYAAELENRTIDINQFELPQTDNNLIVEGAGGLLVPLNDEHLVIDLIQQLELPVVLVSYNYLGSINHTLLSIEALKARGIPIFGIIFNGPYVKSTQNYILSYTQVNYLGNIPLLEDLTPKQIKREANKIVEKIQSHSFSSDNTL